MKCKIAYIDKNPNAANGQHQHRMAGPNLRFFHAPGTLSYDIDQFNPKVVFIGKGDIAANISQIIKRRISVYWYGDWRCQVPGFAMTWAKMCNIALFSVYDINLWKQLGKFGQKNVFVIHQGADTDVFKPLDGIEKKYDITFAGNYFGDSFPGSEHRLKTLMFLKNMGFRVNVVGHGWPEKVGAKPHQDHFSLNKTYNQSKITLGISHFTNVAYGTSNRLYQCMSTGVPHIAWHVPGIDGLFDDSYIGVKSSKELAGKVSYLLGDSDARKEIGIAQRKQILEKHTLRHAWERIENIIKAIYPEVK